MGSKPSSNDLYHDKLSARLLSLIRALLFAGLLLVSTRSTNDTCLLPSMAHQVVMGVIVQAPNLVNGLEFDRLGDHKWLEACFCTSMERDRYGGFD